MKYSNSLTSATILGCGIIGSSPVSSFVVPTSPPKIAGAIRFRSTNRLYGVQFDNGGYNKFSAENETSSFNPFGIQDKTSSSQLLSSSSLEPVDNIVAEEESQLNIWAARGILLLVAMIWATNFPAVKYLETLCFHPPCNHPPSEFAFARFGVAAVVSLPLLFKQRWDVIMAGFECGLFITLGYITQAVALSSISAGKCAFICSLTVVVVPLLSALLEGKPIKPMNLVAAMMALCGVGLLEGLVDINALLGVPPAVADATATTATTAATVDALASVSSSSVETANAGGMLATMAKSLGVSKGDIIALGQPLGFGYTFMRIEHYVEKFKDVDNRVLTISAAQCAAVGLLSLLWVLYDYHGVLPPMGYLVEPHRIATIAWTGIVTTVVAIYLEGVALQKATATDAALTFSSEPVWASIFAAFLLHETMNVNSYVGGAVILSACLLGALSDMPTTEASSSPVEDDKTSSPDQIGEGK